jgi:3',5'-cyclic AMP phosphodiesterase CpdA
MPIHLAPISRRRFLARSLAASAGLALAPSSFATPDETDEHSWALLSDIHLAADRSLVVRGINMTDHFQAVAREVLALPKRPVGLMITGDCAYDNGESGDYSSLADMLTPIRAQQLPVHLVLGNHDNRDRFWEAFQEEKKAKRPLAERQVALLRGSRANWFVLDSLEATRSTPGLLGHAQLDWLANALDANPNLPALVVIHHNPGIVGGNMGLKDTFAFFEVIRPRKQVKAYIYGHTHSWKTEQDSSGVHLINLPPVAYVFTPGAPAGWVHASLEADGMRLELRCLDTGHKDHGQVVSLKWRT